MMIFLFVLILWLTSNIASPLSATTWEPISPHGILSYVERCHVGWECNCGIFSEYPCILEMYVTRHGVVGSCNACGTYGQ